MADPKARRRRAARRVLLACAGLAATLAAERYLVERAHSRPDPERDEPLAERPGRELRVTSFDGTELAVNVVGPERGPTLVFSHGFTLNMTGWHYQWRRFARDHRCVLYDHRGHGRSGRAVGGDYSLQALGRDLRAVLDATAPQGPVVIVGHSMGGMAIMALAEEFPQEFGTRVSGAVFADTTAADVIKAMLGSLGARVGAFIGSRAAALIRRDGYAARVRTRALARHSGLAFLVAEATNFGPKAPPSLIDYVVGVAAEAPPEVWSDLAVSMVEMNLTEALSRVAVPALVIVGEVDRLTPPVSARAVADRLPDARLVVIEGAGHCTMLERHDRFNGIVEAFLGEVDAAAPAVRSAAAAPGPASLGVAP